MKASETLSKKELNMILNALGEYQAKWIKYREFDKDYILKIGELFEKIEGMKNESD